MIRFNSAHGQEGLTLTPDGKFSVFHAVDSAGKHSLFRAANDGSPPERFGDFPANSPSGTIEISPDGSKMLVASWEASSYELWSLENFVPPALKR
jgi:hypothetical protein